MLTFFRRIRQGLVTQNRFSKYILYAIGEIVLVVIGILIALQINNWNENRKKRIEENELYKTLVSSLESDLDDAIDKIAVVDKAIAAQEVFILNSFEEVRETYDRDQIESMLYALNNSSKSFFPNDGLYNKISSNNQLDLIRSPELQMEIIELYEQFYKRYKDLDLSIEEQSVFSLYPHFFSEIEDYYIRSGGRYNIDFETLRMYYDVLNDECRKIHMLTVLTRDAMAECRDEIEALLDMLNKQLQKGKRPGQ